MKKHILFLFFVIHGTVAAQSFSTDFSMALPPGTLTAQPEWHDLDNDGLLDVVLLITKSDGSSGMMVIGGDTTVAIPEVDTTFQIDNHQAYVFADIDRNGKLDLIMSDASQVWGYFNTGNFIFEKRKVSLPPFHICRFHDLDNDAIVDAVLGTTDRLIIRSGTLSGTFTPSDSFAIETRDIEFLDVDADGTDDIFLSGRVNADSAFTGILYTTPLELKFSPATWVGAVGNGAVAHVDGDGRMDVLFYSTEPQTSLLTVFKTGGGAHKREDIILDVRPIGVFLADFNSDGITDIALHGTMATGDTVNLIRYDDMHYDTLSSLKVSFQCFADPDHDGDLDVLQVRANGFLEIGVIEHHATTINLGAVSPSESVGVMIYNNLLIYWENGTDDHTTPDLLTYDLFIGSGTETLQAGSFDFQNGRRLTTAHGNAGSGRFKFIHDIPNEDTWYLIQAVDNGYHSDTTGGGGNGNVAACVNFVKEDYYVKGCRPNEITLNAPSSVLWFSLGDGYLETSSALTIKPESTDTLFYFNPADRGCAGVKVFLIVVEDDTVTHFQSTREVCKGESVQVTIPSGESARWSSYLHGELGTSPTLSYKLVATDTLFALVTSNACLEAHVMPFKVIEAAIEVAPDQARILKGSSIQLRATGGMQYEWHPGQSLTDSTASSPIASPLESTRYTVRVVDQKGCIGEATAMIIVEETGFIPSLFTPNDDGNNDLLKVYGLTTVNDLSFAIYNREGSMVFRAESVTEVMRGWDGTYKGIRQPAGVYHWKVDGSHPTGEPLRLNGKSTGSIVLIR